MAGRRRGGPLTRSQIMARIGGRDTGPEMALRRALREAGIRYRTCVRDLPGRPDVVICGSGLAVFVNGCFWHRHPGCRRATDPKSSTAFWAAKFERNVARDARNRRDLVRLGWLPAVVWECEVADDGDLRLAVDAIASLSRLAPRPASERRPRARVAGRRPIGTRRAKDR